MDDHESQLLTVGQAAGRLGVSPATVRRWATRGELDEHRTDGGHRRFRPDAVERLRMSRAIEGTKEALAGYQDPQEDQLAPEEALITLPKGAITMESLRAANPAAPDKHLALALHHRREFEKLSTMMGQNHDLNGIADTVRRLQQTVAPVIEQHRDVLASIGAKVFEAHADTIRDIVSSSASMSSTMAGLGLGSKPIHESLTKWQLPESLRPIAQTGALSVANMAAARLAALDSGITAFLPGERMGLQRVIEELNRAWEPIRSHPKLLENIQTAATAFQEAFDRQQWLKDLYPELSEEDLEALGAALTAHGWVLPGDLPRHLRLQLWDLHLEGRLDEAEELLVTHYTADDWSPVLDMADSWYGRNCFVEMQVAIGQSLEAARLGLYHPAVGSLIAKIEGVLTRYVVINNIPPLAKYRDDAQYLAAGLAKSRAALKHHSPTTLDEERGCRHLEEVLVALFGWVNFRAMINDPDRFDPEQARRHPVLHGVAADGYGTAGQVLRAVFVLDRLAGIVGDAGNTLADDA